MIVDTSAILAVLFREDEAPGFETLIAALASATGEPLLFKGNDFAQTDVVAA